MMEIKVCIGSACHLKGSYDVIKAFQDIIKEKHLEENITLKGSFCLNHCTEAVSTQVDDEAVVSMSSDKVSDFVNEIIEVKKWNI